MLTLGMVGTSTKENERRVAIHPAHFSRIPPKARKCIFVEENYGRLFRIGDDEIRRDVAGIMAREELFEKCDVVMIFKPTEDDFPFLRDGQILWGALHLVQGEAITQMAIDKKLTCIAMESMFRWKSNDTKDVWIFHTQSELAGYCSVLHSLQLLGIKGWYDQPKKIAIISFGSAGRGAVHACRGMDFPDITVFTQRPTVSVMSMIPGVKYRQYFSSGGTDGALQVQDEGGEVRSFAEELTCYDIIVNCILQDTDRPLVYIRNEELSNLKKGTLIVDVSCDRGMGFECARPTTFDEPLIEVGNGILYYAVDHSPSYLYVTASLEHSKEAYPYVDDLLSGRERWLKNKTIADAVEIEEGIIKNPKILSFQNRDEEYPHRKL
jgi:alanine dehydrogenase